MSASGRDSGRFGGWSAVVFGLLVAAGVWWWLSPREGKPPGSGREAAGWADSAAAGASVGGEGPAIPDRLPGQVVPRAPSEGGESTGGPIRLEERDGKMAGSERAGGAEGAGVQFPDVIELDPVRGRSAEEERVRRRLLDMAFEHRAWSPYAAMLGRSLQATVRQRLSDPPRAADVNSLLKQPLVREALVRQALLTEISDRAKRALDAPAHRAFFDRLLTDPELAESLLISVTGDDKLDAVLATWADIWLEYEPARTTHAQFALACALVFEKPATITWNEKPLQLSAEQRFSWFVRQDAERRLTGRIEKMTASDLVWVVCAPVPESELEWALKKMRLRQNNWGEAYSMIKYDMEKAVNGTSKYDAYTFAEILEKGGICADQAYFATNTARALGIPAAVISGDGARGPHAWFRWLDRDGEWRMSGRFDGYSLGDTHHAQTGRGLSEEWFVRRSGRKAADPQAVAQAYHRLWLGRVLEVAGDMGRAGHLFDLAAAANRELPQIAESRLKHWLAYRAGAPVDEWRDLVAGVKKEFRADSRLMALVQRAEAEMIFPRQDNKAVIADLRRDVRQMEKEAARNGAPPKDEDVARTYARQAESLKQAGNIEGIHSLYRRALDDRANAATFKALAHEYFGVLDGHPDARQKACRELERAWKRHVDTGGDYFDIGSQNSALEVIIASYRTVGDTERADRLQKELDRRQGKAERRAL